MVALHRSSLIHLYLQPYFLFLCVFNCVYTCLRICSRYLCMRFLVYWLRVLDMLPLDFVCSVTLCAELVYWVVRSFLSCPFWVLSLGQLFRHSIPKPETPHNNPLVALHLRPIQSTIGLQPNVRSYTPFAGHQGYRLSSRISDIWQHDLSCNLACSR